MHDKSRKFGLNHPVGTWMVSMKISEEETWEKAKNGTVKGFSIEGLFSGKKAEEDVMMSLLKDIESEIDKTLKQL